MIRPVKDWDKWYIADEFGTNRGTYFHNGIDLNLKTGGDSDLNQPLLCISGGKLVYYHKNSHPTSGFGRHLVYEIEGPWGKRWVMYSHCNENDFLTGVQDVEEGQMIARLGKSGTDWAHVHMSIFKVDPANLSRGIDTIAKTQKELNDWWEDPETFMSKWMNYAPADNPELKACYVDRDKFWKERDEAVQKLEDLQLEYERLKQDSKREIEAAQAVARQQKEKGQSFISTVANRLQTTQDEAVIIPEIDRLITVEDDLSGERKAHDETKALLKTANMTIDDLKREIKRLQDERTKALNLGQVTLAEFINAKIKYYKEMVRNT